ncbi:MAG TPA: 3-hydroxyacyl-ACP dehydratase FabZ [Aliidongia sp.]|uniref:3-hydroxyacyl-ACP dehydratase FabZ n=1 Tax=Aliidongia sp. TaxID=1914230 RepID=UPI002DDD4D5C|nr:3-hydroxyacyl-ACP dehydratase FabZ [Aliidongia sp.]HEV2678501.1 3-hydroxyacyl-ACP dehydratase FabZ [Aliidongia sp.]
MDSVEQKGSTLDLDILQIMELLPHRYPFLLIDKLVELVPNESAIGIKNVTVNEPFFQGHFPGRPIMPGVLIIEAMAQTAACVVVQAMPKSDKRLVYFMSVENARFRKPVVPGDQLRIHVKKERNRGNVWRFAGEARVEGQLMAEATYTAMIVDNG